MSGKKHFAWRTKQSTESNLKRRITTLNNIRKLGGPKIGIKEKQILNELEFSLNKRIIRQYEIIGYSIDGYIPELNLAIEVDERKHFNLDGSRKKKDIQRQKEIEKELNCIFVRIRT